MAARHELVIGRVDFDEALAALQRRPVVQPQGALGIGHAVPDSDGTVTRWRAAALRAEPFDPHSPWAMQQRQALAGRAEAAVLLVHLAAYDHAAPASAADWHTWLLATAPAWRLLCAARDPTLVALWLDIRGRAAGALRLQQQWLPLDILSLPGPGMVRMSLHLGKTRLSDDSILGDLAEGRYSRLAGALGPQVLQQWQRSVFAVVGVGRTGSLVAHTLVRSGASVVLIDPDRVEAHNLCGELLPQHEGLHKADAVARYVRPLVRPGAFVEPRVLDIGDLASGLLLQGCDSLISCVDDDRARLWAAAWSSALLLPHLDVGVEARLQGDVGADLRLIVPGRGCLACVGGFARPQRLSIAERSDTLVASGDFRQQRAGSLRSWAQLASHAGLRMLELMQAARMRDTVFRRMTEREGGGLSCTDQVVSGAADCPLCARLFAMGTREVEGVVVRDVAAQLRARML